MTTLLVDGSNLLLRAVYALSSNYKDHPGLASAPLATFAEMLAKNVRLVEPDFVAVCWDSGYSEFRLSIFPEYKANRVHSDTPSDLFERAQELLAILGVPQVALKDVEADDIIAKYVYTVKDDIVILSADKDFRQLISPRVSLLSPNGSIITNESWTETHPYSPYEYVYVMALMGDKVDNIPGVGGIGPKRAYTIMKESNNNPSDFDLPLDKLAIFIRNLELMDLAVVSLTMSPPPPLVYFTPVGPRDGVKWDGLVEYLDSHQMRMVKHALSQGRFWRKDVKPGEEPNGSFGD